MRDLLLHSSESESIESIIYSRREMLLRSCAVAVTLMTSNLSASITKKSKKISGDKFGNYDFGLDEVKEQRALRLHQESIVIDMVQQGIGGYRVFNEPHLKDLQRANKDYMSLDAIYSEDILDRKNVMRGRWKDSGITVGCVGDITAYGPLAENLSWLSISTSSSEIYQAQKSNGHTVIEYHQPTGGLPRDIRVLEKAYLKGRRVQSITYNLSDFVGSGCTERVDHGLTYYGIEVVKKCNELGMIVDLSHTGALTTYDTCKISKSPVIANHTGSEIVYNHQRNKSDKELRAIADTGGIIGVYAVPFFLTDHPKANINHMLNHIDYIVNLVGWEHVGIGTDWVNTGAKDYIESIFGIEAQASIGFRPEHNINTRQNLIGFDDARDFPNITRGLVARGYSDEEIKGILGENFLRVFKEICG